MEIFQEILKLFAAKVLTILRRLVHSRISEATMKHDGLLSNVHTIGPSGVVDNKRHLPSDSMRPDVSDS